MFSSNTYNNTERKGLPPSWWLLLHQEEVTKDINRLEVYKKRLQRKSKDQTRHQCRPQSFFTFLQRTFDSWRDAESRMREEDSRRPDWCFYQRVGSRATTALLKEAVHETLQKNQKSKCIFQFCGKWIPVMTDERLHVPLFQFYVTVNKSVNTEF